MSTKKNKVQISFIGNMADEVTGSCTKIEYKEQVVLLDFGLTQSGHTILENYKLNKSFLKKIKPAEINSVVITHNHADHLALVPYLYKTGKCNANIYVAKNSSSIMREMLLDCAHIMERDCEVLSAQKDKYYEPIYTENDVSAAMSHVIEVESFVPTLIADGISITFYPNAHILLSQQCEMVFDTVPVNKRVVFTGDLGNLRTLKDKFYMEPFCGIKKTDYLIGESTYGLPNKRNLDKDYDKDIEKIKSVILQFCQEMNGRVLIPSFSLDRLAFFMILLYNMFKDDVNYHTQIVIDSPLAIRLLHCYKDVLQNNKKKMFENVLGWKYFKYIVDAEDSKAAVEDPTPKVILSSSGMMNAGRVVYWTKSVISRANDCILFCGYTGEGTLGYAIKNSQLHKTVAIQGKQYKNRANIVDLKSFSSHMQHDDLVGYYSSILSQKIYLVHGDEDAKLNLKKDIEARLAEKYRTTKVIVTNKSTKLTFD